MELDFNVKSFVDAVSWVTKSYDSKESRSYVKLYVNEEGLAFLSHSNANSYMKRDVALNSVSFEGDDVTEASFAIDGAFLKSFANAIAKSESLLISKDLSSVKTSLNVKTTIGKFTISLLDSKMTSEPTIVEIGEVDDNEFFDTLTRVSRVCDSEGDTMGSFLSSVDVGFDSEENNITVFATNRRIFTKALLSFTANTELDESAKEIVESHILLPSVSASIIPATKGLNSSVTLVCEDSDNDAIRFGYSFPDSRVALFTLSGATPLKSVAVFDKQIENVDNSMIVDTGEFRSAIRTISSLVPNEDKIYFSFTKNGLYVTDSSKSNSIHVTHDVSEYEGEFRLLANRDEINIAFNPISTGSMKLVWSGADDEGRSTAKILGFIPVTEDGVASKNAYTLAALSE